LSPLRSQGRQGPLIVPSPISRSARPLDCPLSDLKVGKARVVIPNAGRAHERQSGAVTPLGQHDDRERGTQWSTDANAWSCGVAVWATVPRDHVHWHGSRRCRGVQSATGASMAWPCSKGEGILLAIGVTHVRQRRPVLLARCNTCGIRAYSRGFPSELLHDSDGDVSGIRILEGHGRVQMKAAVDR